MTVTIGKSISEITLGVMELEDGSVLPYVYSPTKAIRQMVGNVTDIVKVTNIKGINMVCDIDEDVNCLQPDIVLKNALVFSEEPQKIIDKIALRSNFTKEEIRIARANASFDGGE